MKRAIVLAMLAYAAATARADVKIRNHRFRETPPEEQNPPPDKLPQRAIFEATVRASAAGLRPKDFQLIIPEGTLPTTIGATTVVPFASSTEKLAVMILVQGNVRFMGNAEPEPGTEPTDGYHDVIGPAVEAIAKARERETRVGLYTYGDSVVEKVPLGPPDRVTAAAVGPQQAYARVTTKALQRGLEEAVRVLSNEDGRRVLFLIGDGGDQRDGWSPGPDVKKLKEAGIEVYALGASPREAPWTDRGHLDLLGALGAARWANQKEQVGQVAAFLVNEMNNVYRVEFPEIQLGDKQMLPLDGETHTIKIKAGSEESGELDVQFVGPFRCVPGAQVRCICAGEKRVVGPDCGPGESPFPFWIVGLSMTGALVLSGVAYGLYRRSPAPVDDAIPEPMPEPPPMMFAPTVAAPEPARQTVMMNALQLEEDFPIVAWIVPVTGPSAYQTFRLKDHARTVIGANQDCDVRIADPHMSGYHAEIVYLDGDFVLVDRGARNGIKFYDKTVARHTLIDNDLFTCGTTSFKFKTTAS